MFSGDELFTDAQKLRLSEDGTCICFDTKVTSSSYYSEFWLFLVPYLGQNSYCLLIIIMIECSESTTNDRVPLFYCQVLVLLGTWSQDTLVGFMVCFVFLNYFLTRVLYNNKYFFLFFLSIHAIKYNLLI